MKPSILDRAVGLVTLLLGIALLVRMAVPAVPRLGAGHTPQPSPPIDIHSDWPEVMDVRLPISAPEAPIQLVVFTDMECPFCAEYQRTAHP